MAGDHWRLEAGSIVPHDSYLRQMDGVSPFGPGAGSGAIGGAKLDLRSMVSVGRSFGHGG